jgi:hypothetical protein
VEVDCRDKLSTDLDTLLLLLVIQKFGHPSSRLLLKAKSSCGTA